MAARIPRPEPTPAGPAYEGRLLERPGEAVVDQGAGFDLGTLLTRRAALRLAGLGVGAAALAACGSSGSSGSAGGSPATQAASAGEVPDETAGPYPGDGSNGPDVLEFVFVIEC